MMNDDFDKRINASDLIEWIMCAFSDWCVGDVRAIVDHVNEIPSAQPEIIRCRDCRKYRKFDCPMGITVFDAPDPDGYCYKAERRTDGTEQP